MKKAAVALIVILLLVVCLWFVAIPESLIADVVENALGGEYLSLRTEGLQKGFFYSFGAERILLKKRGTGEGQDTTLLVFSDVKGRFDFGSLLKLRPEVKFHGSMGGGEVTGYVRLTGNERLVLEAGDVSINGMPLFEPLGIYGDGMLSGTIVVSDNTAELKFAVRDVNLKSATLGGVFLPLDLFRDMKGAVSVRSDNTAEVRSFAMSGTGIYARVKGTVKGSEMNMSLELMTDSSFPQGPLFLMMLDRYKVSPGYYVVPLKGVSGKGAGG